MARYVKAVYDFSTGEPGEISLRIGDIVKVVQQVSGHKQQTRSRHNCREKLIVSLLAPPPSCLDLQSNRTAHPLAPKQFARVYDMLSIT